MQELENNFYSKSEDLYRERIKKILLIAKPATKKINSWKDLKHYRNDMIAHNLRIKNKSLALYQLGKYKAPRTWNDIILLHLYMKMIQDLIHFEFKEECKDLNSIIRSLEIANNPADYINLKNEPPVVLDQINNLCKKHLKPYKLNKLYFHIE